MAEVNKAHLAIAEANINGLVAPDGTMSKEWVLLLLAKVAAQGAERERVAITAYGYQELGDAFDQLAIDILLGKHLKGEE